jgi:hypothetical protein
LTIKQFEKIMGCGQSKLIGQSPTDSASSPTLPNCLMRSDSEINGKSNQMDENAGVEDLMDDILSLAV